MNEHEKDGPCVICGKQTNSVAGNPSEWPLHFGKQGGDGKCYQYHAGCVLAAIEERNTLQTQNAQLREALEACKSPVQFASEFEVQEAGGPCIANKAFVAMGLLEQALASTPTTKAQFSYDLTEKANVTLSFHNQQTADDFVRWFEKFTTMDGG